MKRLLLLLLSTAIVFSAVTIAPVSASAAQLTKITIDGKSYIRTFYDEFSGTELDSTKWSRSPEYYRQGDYCLWSHKMSYLDGKSHLVLACDYDDQGNLLSGAVRTRDNFEQCYGYFEASIKLQQVDGFWSAFWLMPRNIDLMGIDGGSDGTEIDIMEAYCASEKGINFAVHYDGYGERHKSKGTSVTADVYDGQYHTFSLLWDEEKYVYYIDHKEAYRLTSKQVDISQVATYMKFSLESSLGWTGKPDAADLPSGISVDYVKVYQRADLYSLENTFYGDLDYNLEIDVADLRVLRQYLAKEIVDLKQENADLNNDRKINLKDYLIFRKYLAKTIDKLPFEESL